MFWKPKAWTKSSNRNVTDLQTYIHSSPSKRVCPMTQTSASHYVNCIHESQKCDDVRLSKHFRWLFKHLAKWILGSVWVDAYALGSFADISDWDASKSSRRNKKKVEKNNNSNYVLDPTGVFIPVLNTVIPSERWLSRQIVQKTSVLEHFLGTNRKSSGCLR